MSTDKDVSRNATGLSTVPQAVLKTAIVSEGLSFRVTVASDEKIILFLYFAELEQLGSNETREFNVLYDGRPWYGPYRLNYSIGGTLYTAFPGLETTSLYTLSATSNSTRPPMINAREVYGLKQLESSPTDSGDGQFRSPIDILLLSFQFAGSSEYNGRSFIRDRERDLQGQRRVRGEKELAGGSLPSTGAGVERSGLPLRFLGDHSDRFSVSYLAPRSVEFNMISFALDSQDEYC